MRVQVWPSEDSLREPILSFRHMFNSRVKYKLLDWISRILTHQASSLFSVSHFLVLMLTPVVLSFRALKRLLSYLPSSTIIWRKWSQTVCCPDPQILPQRRGSADVIEGTYLDIRRWFWIIWSQKSLKLESLASLRGHCVRGWKLERGHLTDGKHKEGRG